MISNDFILLRDFVLDKYRLFDQGFANVFLDELTGLIYQGEGSEKFAVGVDDEFGNYFYIRTDAAIDYSDSRQQLSDSSRMLDETIRCYLVAVVDGARPKELVQRLLNTLLSYGKERIRPIRSVYIREVAAAKELAKIRKEDLQYVLEHLHERQVVSLEFQFTTQFSRLPENCLPNPCKSDC